MTLTEEQQRVAFETARQRRKSQEGRPGRVDFKARAEDDGFLLDFRGALAEVAVSIALGLEWDGRFKEMSEWSTWRREGHDVSGLEVKSTKLQHGSLILHRHSNPDQPSVLAIIDTASEIRLVGWVYGHEGQHEEYWRENIPRPCYMVPQMDLHPMVDLLRLLGVDELADTAPEPKRLSDIAASELDSLFSGVEAP